MTFGAGALSFLAKTQLNVFLISTPLLLLNLDPELGQA